MKKPARGSGPPLRFRELRDREPQAEAPDASSLLLAVCPRCEGCAQVVRRHEGRFRTRRDRLHCACGAIQDDPPIRWWLQTPCCGHVLWATGPEHLGLLEDYVRSTLRERLRLRLGDRRTIARLPRWLIVARHRDEVLRALARLRRMLPRGTESRQS
ncbi:hypothetical protein [Nannocystis sp. SCPEA4]|uniref:hypothetical protein n=1 Tax=Nannocystis sp. SCPEA4 TaxID=2996787 RepID=UPI00226E05FB|nr:hypothetical protein [Nannocystis sp. SCPEA4]MCY1055467.1 hypothetical protein [Nannocystis sp. SCPEA4]MCY1055477.1 hypothetical protein [Nannocystis sp. SCPEA4]